RAFTHDYYLYVLCPFHLSCLLFFFSRLPPPPPPTLFPYTTLFRSATVAACPRTCRRNRQKITISNWMIRVISACCFPHPYRYHRSEEHTSELQSLRHLVCRLLLEKKKKKKNIHTNNKHQITNIYKI